LILNLDNYRKSKKRNTGKSTAIPIFTRIFLEDNKLVGEVGDSGVKVIIKDYGEEDRNG
jgi:hypothetical protein